MSNKKVGRLLILVFMLSCILVGCKKTGNEGANGQENKESNSSKSIGSEELIQTGGTEQGVIKPTGRYVQEKIDLPEEGGQFIRMATLDSGVIRAISETAIYDSKDGGYTWENTNLLVLDKNTKRVRSGAIDDQGNMMLMMYLLQDGITLGYESHYLDTEGNDQMINITLEVPADVAVATGETNYFETFAFVGDGTVIGSDSFGTAYLFDPKVQDIQMKYVMDYCTSPAVLDGKAFFVVSNQEIKVFDIKSGEEIKEYEPLNQFFKGTNEMNPVITADPESNSLLLSFSEGLYKYTLGGSVVEQIIRGGGTAIGSIKSYTNDLVQLDDFSYLYSIVAQRIPHLIKFTYSDEPLVLNESTLHIYSLREEYKLKEYINTYQSAHPEVAIEYEIGLSDGITVSDAIRTLNTNIMGGKGPDIIVFSDMPMDTFMEKDMLVDIKESIGKVAETEGIFEGVLKDYSKDNHVYAVPLSFDILTIGGKKESIAAIHDLSSLDKQFIEIRKENEEDSMFPSVYGYFDTMKLTHFFAIDMIKEDGTLDQGILRDYVEKTKEIYQTAGRIEGVSDYSEIRKRQMEKALEEMEYGTIFTGGIYTSLDNMISYGSITSIYDFIACQQGKEQSNFDYKNITVNDKHYFLPGEILGVSAKSQNQEVALDFISEVLTKDYQLDEYSYSIPINQAALDEMVMKAQHLPEGMGESTEPKPEDVSNFKKFIEEVDTPAVMDSIVREMVFEETLKCLNDDITTDQAIENIKKKAGIYLSE